MSFKRRLASLSFQTAIRFCPVAALFNASDDSAIPGADHAVIFDVDGASVRNSATQAGDLVVAGFDRNLMSGQRALLLPALADIQ